MYRFHRFFGGRVICVSSIVLIASMPARGATTLADALIAAYQSNPQLTRQRAQLRATDEEAAIARGGGRPQANIQGDYTQGLQGLRQVDGFNRALTASASVTMPIYQGGRVRSQVSAADQRVQGGRYDLDAAGNNVLLATAKAYAALLRDRVIVNLNLDNVRALITNLSDNSTRFKAGDVTRTDVQQSEARLLGGRTQLATAHNALLASEEDFQRLTGLRAGLLEPLPFLPLLPRSLQEAETGALDGSPALAAADAAIKAARYDTRAAHSGGNPTVSVTAADSYYRYVDRFDELGSTQGNSAQVGVTLNVPLYQGGVLSAQVRRARDLESVAIEQRTIVEHDLIANVHAAFSSYRTALGTITTAKEAVSANEKALGGVRAEAKAGSRQVLDVLNAQLELFNSKIGLVDARYDAYANGLELLSILGMMNIERFVPGSRSTYDPVLNYHKAIHHRADFSDASAPKSVARPIYGPANPHGMDAPEEQPSDPQAR